MKETDGKSVKIGISELESRILPEKKSNEQNINTQFTSSIKSEKLVSVLPKKCSPWNYSDRPPSEMGDLKALENSIKKHGQQEPILLRPSINPRKGIEYDIIFGHRRWLACSHLNISIKAIIKPLSDKEAAFAQKAENESRKDLSNYAKATFYKKLLDNQIFKTEKELSENMQIPTQTFNELMSYTRVHPDVMKNIKNPHLLAKKLACKLATISSKILNGSIRTDYLKAMIQITPQINAGNISYRSLENKLRAMVEKTPAQKEIRKNKLFSIVKDISGDINISINKHIASSCELDPLEKDIYKVIESFIKQTKQSARADIEKS